MKRICAFLASLRLAVALLGVLLLGLATGTILETRLGAEAAGRLVYSATWFLAVQGVFAINVAMGLARRFPWGRERAGFALLHAALLLILVGASLTFLFKIEGTMGLWEGQSSSCIERHDATGRVISRRDLPFAVKLDAFVLSTYPGTQRPSGFLSRVMITDGGTGRATPARIWMNHELHYRGYSLFQSGFEIEGGRRATVLSVSRDPGQGLVFAGFILLLLGMIATLCQQIRRARTSGAALLGCLLLLGAAGQAQVPDLRRLPVQHDGRAMPFDTLARETVWSLTGARAWQGQAPAATVTAWMLDPQACANAPIVEVGSREFVRVLGLPEGATHGAFVDLVRNPRVLRILGAAQRGEGPRGLVREAGRLDRRLTVLNELLGGDSPQVLPVPGDPGAAWGAPEAITEEGLRRLAEGPRLAGWPSRAQIERELFYNRLNPVRLSWITLLGAFLLALAAWIRGSRLLDRLAFGALLAGFGVMTWGLLLRWYVGGRIPAANMYESLLFLGWGIGFFGLGLQALLRNRIVAVNAAFMAALTMALVDLLPLDPFIHPIAPVLSGTPWLAIHVPLIMLGYAILALGVLVAHMQIGIGIFAARRPGLSDRMGELHYWYIFTGSIFLLAGIITGSMWAASSWGRYWGWDPKEVWSLVAFLAYMAILHAKKAGLIGEFGAAALGIIAFQTILMTYLGVNFVLTTGLHSYAVGDSPVLAGMAATALAEALFLAWETWAHSRGSAPDTLLGSTEQE